MSEGYLSQVNIVAFNFAPRSWAQCDGQILPINQNQSLYSLLGTIYGGDGRTSFALPDLRGRTPIHVGNGHAIGQKSGEEDHYLLVNEMPSHKHTFHAQSGNADNQDPEGRLYANSAGVDSHFHAASSNVVLGANMIANTGGGQGHNNMQPYLALNFVICIQGLLKLAYTSLFYN